MRNACRSSSPSSTLPHTASTRVTCAVRAAGTVRPGAHEAKRRVLARRVLVDPRALAADGDDVTGEIGLVASRARFQVAKLLHALVAVIPAEEGDDSTLTLNAQLLQHLWRDRLTQDHAVEPRAHPGGRAAAWRTGHEAERYRKKSQRHRHGRVVPRVMSLSKFQGQERDASLKEPAAASSRVVWLSLTRRCRETTDKAVNRLAAMHPRLSLENTPACVEQIKALQACHADTNYWIKLMGACNEKKMVLDKCFRAQKKVRGRMLPYAARDAQHTSSHIRLVPAGQTQGQPREGTGGPREGRGHLEAA